MRLYRLRRPLILFFSSICAITLIRLAMVAPDTYKISNSDQIEKTIEPHPTTHIHSTPLVIRQPTNLKPYPEGKIECGLNAENLLGVPQSLSEFNCSRLPCSGVTCRALLTLPSNHSIFQEAKTFMKKHPRPILADDMFEGLAENCDTFKTSRNYKTQPLSQEEADFPIAYNILMHKDVEQVERLLRAIYHPQNVYCIHVDGKAPRKIHTAMTAISKCFDNMFIASKLENITYAGFSRLQADINCFKDNINSTVKWKYLLNIAGQSFPLMTNQELVKVFKIYNGANDIEGLSKRILHGRIDNEFAEKNGKVSKTGRKNPRPPNDIMIVRGSAYGIFSREFVEFILTDRTAQALLEWSRHTYSPDEHYWATLHHTYNNPQLHTPGGYSLGVPDNKPWLAAFSAWGGRDRCLGMWRHGVCVFGVGDLPGLLKRKEVFANKFYMDFQPLALECMGNWIEYKSQCPQPFDYNYYEKLPFRRKTYE